MKKIRKMKIYDNFYVVKNKGGSFEFLDVSMSLKSFKDAEERFNTHPHLTTWIPKVQDDKSLKDILIAIYIQRDNLLSLYKDLKEKYYNLSIKLSNEVKRKNKEYNS